MSYCIELTDPVTGAVLDLDAPHQMRGSTYPIYGTTRCAFGFAYNHAQILHVVRFGGIMALNGMSGAESLPILDAIIGTLGNDVDPDYWKATEGNVKRAMHVMRAFATSRPDGVWRIE